MSDAIRELTLHISTTLLHVTWIGFVIGGMAIVADTVLRSSAGRYRAHAMSLAVMVVSAPVVFCLVASEPSEAPVRIAATAPSVESSMSAASADSAATGSAFRVSDSRRTTAQADVHSDAATPAFELPVPLLVTIGYSIGVLGMLARLIAGIHISGGVRSGSRSIDDPGLLEMIRDQSRRLNLRQVPVVQKCESVAVPIVLGLLRPVILLPWSVVSGLTESQLRDVITHELVHIRRWDHIAIVLQRIAEAVLFFHPAVWYIGRRLRVERENRCDDLVVSAGSDPVGYAESLCRVAELSLAARIAPVSVAMDGGSGSGLRQRIARLLEPTPQRQVRLRRSGSVTAVVLVILAAIGVSFAGLGSDEPELIGFHQEDAPSAEKAAAAQRFHPLSEEMRRAFAWLVTRQRADGSWPMDDIKQHTTGGVALALIAFQQTDAIKNIDGQRALDRGLGYLANQQADNTYDTGLQLRALCASHDPKHAASIKRSVAGLVHGQGQHGGWSYTLNPGGADGSNTGYAVRGLAAAAARGYKVPQKTWTQMCNYWLTRQQDSGGWAYTSRTGQATATMTLTGMHCLTSAKAYLEDKDLIAKCDQAVARGRRWCEKNKHLLTQATHWLYYQFDVLTVVFTGDDSPFAKDLMRTVHQRLKEMQRVDGSWANKMPLPDTCLAMQALQRAQSALARGR